MAIKKLYRLQSINGVVEQLPKPLCNELWEIDEDYTSKKEWLKSAKKYVNKANDMLGNYYISKLAEGNYKTLCELNLLTVEDLFGKCEYNGWCYCTECDEYFWADDGHDCDDFE